MENGSMTIWELLFRGGPLMVPIIFCSILSLAIAVERFIYLFYFEKGLVPFKNEFFLSLQEKRLKDALRLCETNPSPIARVFKAGFMKYGAKRQDIKSALEQAVHFEVLQLHHRLEVLNLLMNLTPLLGFLGTVGGMVVLFHEVQLRSNLLAPVGAGDLASGLWQALLTTVAGISVAIATYIVLFFLRNHVERLTMLMQHICQELLNLLCQMADLSQPNPEV